MRDCDLYKTYNLFSSQNDYGQTIIRPGVSGRYHWSSPHIIHAQTMIGFLVSASEQWRSTSSDYQPFERNLLPFSRILFAARRVAAVHCTTIPSTITYVETVHRNDFIFLRYMNASKWSASSDANLLLQHTLQL